MNDSREKLKPPNSRLHIAQSRVPTGSDGIPINEQEESERATEGLPGLGELYPLVVGQALGQAVSFLT